MLLQQTHINAAMNLSAMGVSFALRNNNYKDDSVNTATYVGMTANGSFVYACTYFDEDLDEDADCIVYVYYNNLCKLIADY